MITLTIYDFGILTALISVITSLVVYIWNFRSQSTSAEVKKIKKNLDEHVEDNKQTVIRIFDKIDSFKRMESKIAKIDNDIEWIKKFLINK